MELGASSRCARPAWQRQLVAVALLFSVVSATFAQTGPISLPEEVLPELREHLRRALEQSPEVQLANLQLARREAEYLVARAPMLPQVGINANYSISQSENQDVPNSQTDDDGFFYALAASQPVFHWGALQAQREIGEIERLISGNELDEARRRIAMRVRSMYFGLVIKRMELRNQEFAAQLMEDGFAFTEERFKGGQISADEWEQAQLGAAEARNTFSLYRLDWENSLRAFGRLINDPQFDGSSIRPELPRPAYDPAQLEELFGRVSLVELAESNTAKNYELRVEQEEKRYQIARALLLPKVSMNASYGLTNLTTATAAGIEQTGVLTATAAIGVNWAIFDGFASRGQKRAALASRRLNERNLELWLQTTLGELQRIQAELRLQMSQLAVSERRLELAQRAIERVRGELAAGRAAQSDVNNVLRHAQGQEIGTARERANLMNRWVEYFTVAGLDLGTLAAEPGALAPNAR